ncbi:transcriptional regulator, HxlR family [Paenibacillaceae bacterium GAS479]|nr:transcriptional regulator, HxlR family [Paenibacillaceae bacterium GAS479]
MGDEMCELTGIHQKDTSFGYTLSVISGKFKMTILYWLFEKKVMRFNELQRGMGTISFKSLSMMLKELEADGLISREEFPQIPPKVEYTLTERGRSIIPVLDMMCNWGEKNGVPDVKGETEPLPV